MGLDS
jgi:FAD binding domain